MMTAADFDPDSFWTLLQIAAGIAILVIAALALNSMRD